ncbi:MAG: acetylxylan esterase [Clostridia bacterium]|nr:acetylxylan esterase [Clostridia bacterium]
MRTINSDLCHLGLFPDAEKKLRFTPEVDFDAWKAQVREKFITLLGLDRIAKNACDPNVEIEEEVQMDGYRRIRFTFESEKGAVVPCYLLVPDDAGEKKYPIAITMQGHSSGFHNSVGIPKSEKDAEYQQDRGMFGVQAVRHGFVSLCLEQRGMGESISEFQKDKEKPKKCIHTAMTALALGRTILGERVWDISRAIDVLEGMKDLGLDTDKILITGNSGGGTISFYAACYDERIKFSAPSCAFCSYLTSILNVPHCSCNYIPGILDWFEMEDLSCLIAPRPFTVIAGQGDKIFPIEGVRDSFKVVQEIYQAAGAPDACRMVETPMPHWWCKDIVWDAILDRTAKMGW